VVLFTRNVILKFVFLTSLINGLLYSDMVHFYCYFGFGFVLQCIL
jgi:hypothetical protein